MKQQNLLILSLLMAFFVLTSCGDDDGLFHNCDDADGAVVEQVLDLPDFTGVDLKINANVYITQGDFFEVVAKGEQNVIDELILNVKNDTWGIEFDHCVNDYGLDLYITMPYVEYLAISGSGEIRGDNFFDPEQITLRISGSGRLCLGLYSQEVDARITGSGNIELEGEAEHLDTKISGSGDISAFSLITQSANIEITGSGDASIHVLDFLKIRITGSGDVYYKGFPGLDVEITGSGRVVDAN